MTREEIKKQWELEFGVKYEEYQRANVYTSTDILDFAESIVNKLLISDVMQWVAFDFMKIETRPQKYGKYLVTRKDGKIHWETWNGSGWAYNHNEIRYWAVIQPPCA